MYARYKKVCEQTLLRADNKNLLPVPQPLSEQHNLPQKPTKRLKLKVLLIGNPRVGKTSIMNQFVNKTFSPLYKHSIGPDFLTKKIVINDTEVNVEIWDIPGTEKFEHNKMVSLYKNAQFAFFVHDLSNPLSFKDLGTWIQNYCKYVIVSPEVTTKRPEIVILGNKCDVSNRKVSYSDLKKLLGDRQLPYSETNACNYESVEGPINKMIGYAMSQPDIYPVEEITKTSNEEDLPSENESCNKETYPAIPLDKTFNNENEQNPAMLLDVASFKDVENEEDNDETPLLPDGPQSKGIEIKVMIIGDCKAGKTSIAHRYIRNHFSEHYEPTTGADFRSTELIVNDTPVVLQIWNEAGDEKFRSMTSFFYRGTDVCLVTFDLTESDTFKNLSNRVNHFEDSISNPSVKIPYIVLGNKCDLQKRQVSIDEAQAWCDQRGMLYYETSAKNNRNISTVFQKAAELGLQRKL